MLALRMLGWAATLPLLKYVLPLPRLVRLATPRTRRAHRDPFREQRIIGLAGLVYRATSAGTRDNCLERSLLTYRFLAQANAQPRLHVGIRKGSAGSLDGHVWVTVDDLPVRDRASSVEEFARIIEFDASGIRQPFAGG